jgi:hypothetical protein
MAGLAASGTQTATLTTEHELAAITESNVYVLEVDTANLVNGERVLLRIYVKTLSGGTERLDQEATYVNAQTITIKRSLPVPANISFRATLRQDGGTGRDFPWKVLALES